MNSFDDILVENTEILFDALTPSTITYLPKEGDSRSIEALTFYVNEDVEGAPIRSRISTIKLVVRNNSDTGISSNEIDTGGDKIELPVRKGDSEIKEYRIMKILSQNAGFLRLELK